MLFPDGYNKIILYGDEIMSVMQKEKSVSLNVVPLNAFENIKVQGIGKLIINSGSEHFNIPHLHFITFRLDDEETQIFSFCLETNTSFRAEKIEESVQGLVFGVVNYISGGIKVKADLDNLIELVGLMDNEALWAKYRQFEFTMAKEKKDLSDKFVNHIKNAVIAELAKDGRISDMSVELEFRNAA